MLVCQGAIKALRQQPSTSRSFAAAATAVAFKPKTQARATEPISQRTDSGRPQDSWKSDKKLGIPVRRDWAALRPQAPSTAKQTTNTNNPVHSNRSQASHDRGTARPGHAQPAVTRPGIRISEKFGSSSPSQSSPPRQLRSRVPEDRTFTPNARSKTLNPKQPRDNDRNRPHTPQHRTSSQKASPPRRSTRPQKHRPDVFIPSTVTVANLANLLDVKLDRLQQRMKRVGMGTESNYDHILTSDYAALLAEEFGRNAVVDDQAAFDIYPPPPHPNPTTLPPRPPVVTIMGHVDHGKTTLLDTLRSASVAKGEAGGITQHIGAFSVPVKDSSQTVTFLDTPGHAAFSAMRARGANVTDIIVLVVAADDGIMPQTREVINLVKSADGESGLLVAINKIDKPGVDIDAVKRSLLAEGVQLEDFGGDVPVVHVSGLTGEGMAQFLETLSAMAEIQDLRAEKNAFASGHVLESHMRKGLGPVATVLVSSGSLKVGSHVLSGLAAAKIRQMVDSSGKPVEVAYPGSAVTVSGWKTIPKAGDTVLEAAESDIKKALVNRERKSDLASLQEDAQAINAARRQERDIRAAVEDGVTLEDTPNDGPKELKLLIKADVSGSSEAVEGALTGIGNDLAMSKVISSAVGDINESDVMLAKAANATIVGFSVSIPRSIQAIANQNAVPVTTSNIIYKLMDDVRARVSGLLPPIIETKVTGEATVLQLFDIQLKSKQSKTIAGCRVINGIMEKNKLVRVVRNGEAVYDGSLDTMRQLKKEITEVRKGNECGLAFENFIDLKVGDLIQAYDRIEKPAVI